MCELYLDLTCSSRSIDYIDTFNGQRYPTQKERHIHDIASYKRVVWYDI